MLFFQITGYVFSFILIVFGIMHFTKNATLKTYYNKKNIILDSFYKLYGLLNIFIAISLIIVCTLSIIFSNDLVFAIVMGSVILLYLLMHLLLMKKYQNKK